MEPPTFLKVVYEPVSIELKAVYTTVNALWTDALRLVYDDNLELKSTQGKLLRPAMCLLSAGAIGAQDLHRFVDLAATFEMLHLAALVHDDVVDSADIRRGTRSLNALWDDHAAVLGGDYLVARATSLLTPYDSCPLIACVVDSVRQMAEGELRSIRRNANTFSEDDCIQLARQKTASLFAACCVGPTYLIDTPHRLALERYGLGFGTAFQLSDDILDLAQTEEKLGKPSCGDVSEGKATLPLRFMRDGLDPDDTARLDAMRGAAISEQDRAWVAKTLERTGARGQTEAIAHRYVDNARKALDELPESPYRRSLTALLDFVLTRGS
ncbi:MAG TPA: polyprenyl synthetase family protein [Candidatus Hydrogenedentes bacterium]|nr:polyprenyl synthetase family protein [Candidatus Hydrogenedentota bacterium]